ncbi:MAG TPA: ATP-binding protein [Allosphingosinicella sp.]
MSSKTVEIQVQEDHLERLSQVRKPVLAVAELIWNALDADADQVDVILHEDGLGGIAAIEVRDDGHGIPFSNAEALFSRLGGSWKKGGKRSQEKDRLLHGQEGRGRFRAFGLGRITDWEVTYSADGQLRAYRISMARDALRRVVISDEAVAPPGAHRGVTVTVRELHRHYQSLQGEGARQELAQIFALYLRQYPGARIWFDGERIDPASAIDHEAAYPQPAIEAEDGPFASELEIVEWKMQADRRLFLCDAQGFPLDSTTPGIHAPGFSFTAYLKSDYFAKLLSENRLELAELDSAAGRAVESAKATLRDHFRRRAAERAAGLVERWRDEDIYPYEGEASSAVEEVERQVFNVVAFNVNHYSPSFEDADERTKRLQLRLLRNAIEHAPGDLSRILTEVLGLPQEKRQELADLLDRTTLSHIIGASKIITDRLEFLRGLEAMVFDAELSGRVRERNQLHRVLADNAWIFGEQYHLSVDDESLTEVLRQHLGTQRREVVVDAPVTRTDGRRGIIDLMFSRNIQLAGSEEREHLVVELKRPTVVVNAEVITQVESYAFAVANDPRFKGVPAKWVFWAISTDLDDFARQRANQRDRPKCMIHQSDDPSITIWVKTWSQVINECRARLRFFSEKLAYAPDRDASLAHLRTTYDRYLSGLFADDATPGVGEEMDPSASRAEG